MVEPHDHDSGDRCVENDQEDYAKVKPLPVPIDMAKQVVLLRLESDLRAVDHAVCKERDDSEHDPKHDETIKRRHRQ